MSHVRRATSLLAALGAVLGVVAPAWPHTGQHLGLKISINDEEVALDVLLSHDFARQEVPLSDYNPAYSPADQAYHFQNPEPITAMRQAYEKFLEKLSAVEIDGLAVKPLLGQVQFVPAADALGIPQPGFLPPDVALRIVYPCKGRPKRVAIAWELYPQDPAQAAAGLPAGTILLAELEAYAERRIVLFTPEEPEVVWHAPAKPVAQRVQPIVATAGPRRIAVPVLSLGVVVIWGLGLLTLRWAPVKRSLRRSAWCSSVVPLALAVYFHNVAVVSLAAPWGTTVRVPGEQEATEIFTTLQRNVYRAFDYTNESDIYDVLAQSVAGDLLDQVYNEVYQSLILRDQGGAVAHVHSVDVLETKLISTGRLPDSDAPVFRCRCRWQVYGVVAHWGHFHSRTNEYEAVYTVAQLDHTWKIIGVETLSERRIDAEDETTPAEKPQP